MTPVKAKGKSGGTLGACFQGCFLFQSDIGVWRISFHCGRDFFEARLMPCVECAPEAAWFLRSKQAHVENAIAISIFKCAHGPSTGGDFEFELWNSARIDPELVHRGLEKAVRMPKGDVNGAFSGRSKNAPIDPERLRRCHYTLRSNEDEWNGKPSDYCEQGGAGACFHC